MKTMSRLNPFRSPTRFEPIAGLDELFRNFGLRPAWTELAAAPEMKLDLSEDDRSYHVKAEMPGVAKEDIEVAVEGAQVTISGEVKRGMEKKQQDEKELYTERYYGKVFRSFTLPQEVESDQADAHYEAGVLTLTLPKKANGSAKRISIS